MESTLKEIYGDDVDVDEVIRHFLQILENDHR